MRLLVKSCEISKESHQGPRDQGRVLENNLRWRRLLEKIRVYLKRLDPRTRYILTYSGFSSQPQANYLANYFKKFEKDLGLRFEEEM